MGTTDLRKQNTSSALLKPRRFLQFMLLFSAVLLLFFMIGWRLKTSFSQYTWLVSEIRDGWYYYENGEKIEVELPADIRLAGSRHLALYNDRIDEYTNGNIISTKAAIYKPDIIRNGNLLYSYDDSMFPRNDQMASEIFCNAVINNVNGYGPLVIVYHTDKMLPVSGSAAALFHIPAVYTGNSRAVFLYNCSDNLASIVLMLMFFAAAVFAFTEWLLFRGRYRSKVFLDISLFLLIAVIWRISDWGMMLSVLDQYRGGILSTLSFYAFMLLGATVTWLARDTAGTDEKFFDTVAVLFYLNIIVQVILNVVFDIDYINMLIVTQMLIPFCTLLIMAKMYGIYTVSRDVACLVYLLGLIFVFVMGLISLALYWMANVHYELIMETGMFVFAFFMLYELTIHNQESFIEWKKQTMDSSRHIDEVTGMYDSYMFEHDMQWLQKEEVQSVPVSGKPGNLGLLMGFARSMEQEHTHEPKPIGYLRINIHIDGITELEPGEKIHELFRLAAAGRAVKNVFVKNASCYCLDHNTICVLMPGDGNSAHDFVEKLDRMISAYNANVRADDAVKLTVNVNTI